MNERMMKAQVAMLKVQERALEKGMVVSLPTVEGMRYDCVIDDGKELLKAQVKYAGAFASVRDSSGAVHVNLVKAEGRGANRPYGSDEVDLILIYVAPVERVCVFRTSDFEGKTSLHVRYQPTKNKQAKGCVMVEDRLW